MTAGSCVTGDSHDEIQQAVSCHLVREYIKHDHMTLEMLVGRLSQAQLELGHGRWPLRVLKQLCEAEQYEQIDKPAESVKYRHMERSS